MLGILSLGAMVASLALPISPSAQECPRQFGGAIMRPDKKTPQPGQAWGAGQNKRNGGKYIFPASIRWGSQACTCRGAGQCLCCRRFDRAIRAHQARVATAGGC